MRILVVEPEHRPEVREIDGSLEAMQNIVSPCRYIRNYIYNHTILGNQRSTREGLSRTGQPFLFSLLFSRQRLVSLHQLGHIFALGHTANLGPIHAIIHSLAFVLVSPMRLRRA